MTLNPIMALTTAVQSSEKVMARAGVGRIIGTQYGYTSFKYPVVSFATKRDEIPKAQLIDSTFKTVIRSFNKYIKVLRDSSFIVQ